VQWRVTNTTNDRKRGQVVPNADWRAYTDRLNALFSSGLDARVQDRSHEQQHPREEGRKPSLGGKVLVAGTVTIIGLWSHCGTGEEWPMTTMA